MIQASVPKVAVWRGHRLASGISNGAADANSVFGIEGGGWEDRFEIAKPSLDDIFITVVKEGLPASMTQLEAPHA